MRLSRVLIVLVVTLLGGVGVFLRLTRDRQGWPHAVTEQDQADAQERLDRWIDEHPKDPDSFDRTGLAPGFTVHQVQSDGTTKVDGSIVEGTYVVLDGSNLIDLPRGTDVSLDDKSGFKLVQVSPRRRAVESAPNPIVAYPSGITGASVPKWTPAQVDDKIRSGGQMEKFNAMLVLQATTSRDFLPIAQRAMDAELDENWKILWTGVVARLKALPESAPNAR